MPARRYLYVSAILSACLAQPALGEASGLTGPLTGGAPRMEFSDPLSSQTSTPIDQNRVDRNQPVLAPEQDVEDAEKSGAAVRVDAGDPNAPPIENIKFVGTDVPLVVAEAAHLFVGQPASRGTLKALTNAMSAAYGRSNVALFTVVIPKQDLSSGTINVLVAEGFIQQVVLEGEVEGRSLSLVKAYANKLTGQQPTSRATLERYLSLIRDIPGLKVTSRLEIGQGRGAVRLILNLDYQKPTITAGFDSRRSSLIDSGQFDARARIYSLLREGDKTEVSGTAAADFEQLYYIAVSHSTPIGSEGARATIAVGHLETKPSDTPISGNAETFAVMLTYPVLRSNKRNMSVTVAVDGVNSDNTAYGSLIASEKSRAARAALGFSVLSQRNSLSGGVTLSQGLGVLGADVNGARGDESFFKVNMRASFAQQFGKALFLRMDASGQWSNDPLPAVERFSVGGASFGRAFEKGIINADRGVAGSSELALRPISSGKLRQSELYLFADYADVSVFSRGNYAQQNFDMASAGGGVRLAYTEKTMLGFEGARTINKPYAGYASDWRFTVSWRVAIKP